MRADFFRWSSFFVLVLAVDLDLISAQDLGSAADPH